VIVFPQSRLSTMMRAAICLLVLAVLLSGCGYKGPLYLPKPKSEAPKPAPAPQQDEKKPDPS
jgi:predicted small lipoprotein YifL